MIKSIATLLATLALALPTQADEGHTRGIGVYPGRPSESFEPTLVRDYTYRNVALHRMVYQSSAADVNLTGQLITDGEVCTSEPCQVVVSTPKGALDKRHREKTIDGNPQSLINVEGQDTYLQLDWTWMTVAADELRLNAEAVYDAAQANAGYTIEVMASADGKTWTSIGREVGDGLPGVATRQTMSSDPNKQESKIRLPLRKVQTTIPLSHVTPWAHLRVVFRMKGAAYWRVRQTDFYRKGVIQDALPSAHYTSAWASEGGGTQWVMVDLGTQVTANRVVINWIHPAQQGELQVSDDGKEWRRVASLRRSKKLEQSLNCRFKARYVRLLMTRPDASGRYVLSELQVMGFGGLVARPHERMGMRDGRYYLNGGDWQLSRKGSDRSVLATVPATVLQSYMNIGAVANTNYSDNMRAASESYFNADFTYRTSFDVPADYQGRHVYLNFDGINWKATVKLNGQSLGRVEGAFKRGRFDVTRYLKATGNQLEIAVERPAHFGAVKIKNTESTDMNGGYLGADNPTFHASIGWDWITTTPGREVGIWNDVYLTANGGVSLSDPLVDTHLDLPDTLATMTPSVWVANDRDTTVTATLSGWIGPLAFAKTVRIAPHASSEVAFSPKEFAQLARQPMHLWWPTGYGTPYLYDAGFAIADGSGRIDSLHYQAGIRQMTYANLKTQVQIFVNGQRFIPLGGNWGFSENNLNYRGREYDIAVGYHSHMNCNMIRNWVGQTGDEEFYEACDRHGVMIWQDFWLANPADGPNPYDNALFLDNATDYLRRIRRHPSIGIYVGRNEGYPPVAIDRALRQYIDSLHPGMGYIPSSSDEGVSGHGPYRLIPLKEYFDKQSHKLHSERGLPNIPSYESMCRMLSPDDLWPIGLGWAQHDFTQQGAQRGSTFVKMLTDRFGEPDSARQFTALAQWLNYDGYRAMYEASQQERQGLLIWMSHPCWPSTVWQTYDYYLEPTAAYFGVRKACEPLHIMYNPRVGQVQVVNMSRGPQCDMEARMEIRDMYGRTVKADSAWVDTYSDVTENVMPVAVPDSMQLWYLHLSLYDRGHLVSDNFYVQSRRDTDFRALNQLPQVQLQTRQQIARRGRGYRGTVTVTNPSATPVLMIRLNLKGDDGEQILPVLYSDNYFALMPGESRDIEVSFGDEDTRGTQPRVEVSAFNATATAQ